VVASLDEPQETDEGSLTREVADPAPTPSAQAMSREHMRHVANALETLDQESRTIVVLRDVQGLSYEEIAEILQCRIGTVKSRLSRARLKLRAALNGVL